MKKLLFVLVFGVSFFVLVGCNNNQQPPAPTPLPPQPSQVTPMPSSAKIVVYDFWAPWCPPCRAFGPTFEAWKKKYSNDRIEFKKVNTDEDQALAAKFNISSIPCIIITANGSEVKRWTGAPKESDVLEYLK